MSDIEYEDDYSPYMRARKQRQALLHLAITAATVVVFASLTYAFPDLANLRPWSGEKDDLPLATLGWKEGTLPAWAGAGSLYGRDDTEHESSRERVADELGSSVAANLGGDHAKRPPKAVHTTHEKLTIDPADYEGIEVEIQHVEVLTPFFESLRRTALGETGATTRIVHYGDSSIATDLITHTMRRHLQLRFGDAGHGFVLVAKGYMPYRHRDLTHSASREWSVYEIVRNADADGLYGYGGVQIRGRPRAWARFGTDDSTPVGGSLSRFEIWYQGFPQGGDVRYTVDDGETQEFSTRTETTEDGVKVIEVPDGPHEIDIRFGGGGQLRVYGVVLERDVPGVVYDSIGLVGARAARLLNFDAEHIRRQIARRDVRLLVLGFGGNEASDNIRQSSYEEDYIKVIRRMRGDHENLACLVFAPLDQAERDRFGKVETMPSIPRIVEAQRAAAAREGCAFFNTWEAMGGSGSMGRWYRSRPRLALGDFRHATPRGYEVIANLFYKAILKAFAGYLAEHPVSPAPAAAVDSALAQPAAAPVSASEKHLPKKPKKKKLDHEADDPQSSGAASDETVESVPPTP